jgi:hypothetical protein
MNFITGNHLPRRTFLRGMGASMALPFLDAMVPAARASREALADPTRLIATWSEQPSTCGRLKKSAATTRWCPTTRWRPSNPTATT